MIRNLVEKTHRDALAHRRESERKAAATTLFQEAVYSARTDVVPPLWQVGTVPVGFVVALVPKLGQDPRFLFWGEGKR